jgi:hypothetical protein
MVLRLVAVKKCCGVRRPVDSSLRWNDGFESATRIEAASFLKQHEQY